MLEIKGSFITGAMVGIEFPSTTDVTDEGADLKFAMILDLAILRITFLYWKEA